MAANGPLLACDLAEPPWRVKLWQMHRVLCRAADWNIATFTTEAVA